MKRQDGPSPWIAIPNGILLIALGIFLFVVYHNGSNWLSILVPTLSIITGLFAIGRRINLILKTPRLLLLSIALVIVVSIFLVVSFTIHR